MRPLYIVTLVNNNQLVKIKKVLHFHSSKQGKYLNTEYDVKASDLIPASQPSKKEDCQLDVLDEVKKILTEKPRKRKNIAGAKNLITYSYDSSDDSDKDEPQMLETSTDGIGFETVNVDVNINDEIVDAQERILGAIPTLLAPEKEDSRALPDRVKRKSALEARSRLKKLASKDNYEEIDLENERDEGLSYEITPIPSRNQSPIRDDVFQQVDLEDDPPQFSYEAEHTTTFSGGDPTYLGQFYDVSLGSPLLMSLTPDMSLEEQSLEVIPSPHNSRLLPLRPRGLLPFEQEDYYPEVQEPESPLSDNSSIFPTRIFYRSRRASDTEPKSA